MARHSACLMTIGLLILGQMANVLAPEADAHANGTFYIEPSQVDLDHLLAPPPALGSAAETKDLAAVVEAEKERTAEEAVAAEEDHKRSVFRFADVMGPEFTPQNLPFATKFFERVYSDQNKVVNETKTYFARPRPFVVDSNLAPMVYPKPTPVLPERATRPSPMSWPSCSPAWCLKKPQRSSPVPRNTATTAWWRARISRRTSKRAGLPGTVIDSVFFHEPRFMTDFNRARVEGATRP